MRADGADPRRVTTLPAGAGGDYAPDRRRLVFTRYRDEGGTETAALFTIRTDGRDGRQVTSLSLNAGDADWSPDGERLVFEAYPDPASRGDVYVVDANSRHLVNLTRNVASDPSGSADPVWAPNGRSILFPTCAPSTARSSTALPPCGPMDRTAPSWPPSRRPTTNRTGSRSAGTALTGADPTTSTATAPGNGKRCDDSRLCRQRHGQDAAGRLELASCP